MAQNRSPKSNTIPTALIAPCGLNCRLCAAFLREKNVCSGCRRNGPTKSEYCITCPIKNCAKLAASGSKYCFACESFPCARLRRLDKRYRTRYVVSTIENLQCIRDLGIRRFIRQEKERRVCRECGSLLCVHKPQCPACGRAWR